MGAAFQRRWIGCPHKLFRTVMSSSTICGYPSWRSNRRQAARSECLLGFQCWVLAALARNARLPKNARLAMLGSQRSARNVIPYAQLAMLSSHVTVPGPTEARIALPRLEVLGSKRSGSQRSARVALLRLKVSGSRRRESLSVRVQCEHVSRAWEPVLARVRSLAL